MLLLYLIYADLNSTDITDMQELNRKSLTLFVWHGCKGISTIPNRNRRNSTIQDSLSAPKSLPFRETHYNLDSPKFAHHFSSFEQFTA